MVPAWRCACWRSCLAGVAGHRHHRADRARRFADPAAARLAPLRHRRRWRRSACCRSSPQEWQTLGLARRARGVDAGRIPLVAVRLFAGKLLSLLVGCHSAWQRGWHLPWRRGASARFPAAALGAPAAHAGADWALDRRRAAALRRRPSGSAWHSAPGGRCSADGRAYHRADAAHRRAAVPGRRPGAGRNPHHS